MATFGDLRGAVELARHEPARVGAVVWCVLCAPTPEEAALRLTYALDALREPVSGYRHPLADVVRFACEGVEVLRVIVPAHQRRLEDPIWRLEDQDLVLFACALAHHAVRGDDDEPQVAREGTCVDVTDGELTISWGTDADSFIPGLNMEATAAEVLSEHLAHADGGPRLVAYDEARMVGDWSAARKSPPSDPGDVLRAEWDRQAVVDPEWTRDHARALGVGHWGIKLSNLVKRSSGWEGILRASRPPGFLASCAPGVGHQELPRRLHAFHVDLATEGALSCASLTLADSRWLVRGHLHVEGVLEVLRGAELCVLGSITCGGIDVHVGGRVVARGDVDARAVSLRGTSGASVGRLHARSLRALWSHLGEPGALAVAIGPPEVRLSSGGSDVELDRLDAMLRPVWRGVTQNTAPGALLDRALHALATLPLERVFTPEALREHRLEHPKSTPRTPPQEP